jgi:hypothetical protein
MGVPVKNRLYNREQFLFVALVLTCGCVTATGGRLYHVAKDCSGRGNREEAFLLLEQIVNQYPHSSRAADALFGIGEYFYHNNDLYDASVSFERYVRSYPDTVACTFAKLYLLKIDSQVRNNDYRHNSLYAELHHELFSRPVLLLFTQYSRESYRSALGNTYELRHFPDRVEICLNDTVFFSLSP